MRDDYTIQKVHSRCRITLKYHWEFDDDEGFVLGLKKGTEKMKVELKDTPKLIPCTDMEVGDTGIIRDNPELEGQVLLRCYDYFVSLSDPQHTWEEIRHNLWHLYVEPKTFKLVEVSE